MANPMLTVISPLGALRRLLDDPDMRGVVVVSEVHSCSSYARLLTADKGSTIALGLRVEQPVGAASVGTWVRNTASGNFKSQVDKRGERTFFPLFRLFPLSEKERSQATQTKDSADLKTRQTGA
ncbi:hypothetical protein DFH06DRAFT_483603 [Mycena polygramma]|nr:hypothetical protein DFH06DRAFT_483603 [Mycena polygramma]